MAKEDFILRTTTNAPLTTKGSAISQVERDANWIALYNILVELSQNSTVSTYDAGVTYDDTVNKYVTYNGQLWKYINSTPATDQTPSEGAYWTAVYASSIARHVKEYRACLTQTSTNAPVENGTPISNIGTVTYARTGVGIYTITKNVADGGGSTIGFFTSGTIINFSELKGFIEVTSITSEVITFKTYDTSGTLSDGILTNTGLSITIE